MGFWDSLFGGGSGGDKPEPARRDAGAGANRQLPSSMVAKEFGEVNVRRRGALVEVRFTILMEPVGTEGWQTGVALDASGSMTNAYGQGLAAGPAGPPPASLQRDYERRGWLTWYDHQGERIPIYRPEAKADLVARRHHVWTANEVEPLARQATAYLAK